MVVLTSVEALSSSSPIGAAFAQTAGANVPAGNFDDEKLDDSEDVGEGKEKIKDENRDHDDELVNKRKLQQVVLITSRLTVINWMKIDAEQNEEQGLILRAINKFSSKFRGNYKLCRNTLLETMLLALTVCRPIIPNPQSGERCAIKLVNMAVQIQRRYQQLCHQFERASTLRLLLAEDDADLYEYPTYKSSCCPHSCGLRPLESISLRF